MRKWKCVEVNDKRYLTLGKIYETNDKGLDYSIDDGFHFIHIDIENLNYGKFKEIKEDKNMKRDFKVGDKVRIRQWDDMANEFGIDREADIKTNPPFVTNMQTLCREECEITHIINDIVKLKFNNEDKRRCNWEFSTDMIEHINQPTSKTITITTSDTITTLTDGTHTTTVNRYHTDKHNERIAVSLVIDKYYDELKQIEIENNMPKVGDMVRVVGDGRTHANYDTWFVKNNIDIKYALKWKRGESPNNGERYKIVAIHPHGGMSSYDKKSILALIEDERNCYIINIDGLEVVR